MMDYADAIRRQAEDAPRAALPAVTALMWKAFGDGKITEVEAEALSVLIEARQLSANAQPVGQTQNREGISPSNDGMGLQGRQNRIRTSAGSRPRTNASMERRRRWAASGRLPPALAARFTLAEHAVLALVAAETARRGDCRLAIEHAASVVGVSRSTVKAAIREARKLGLLTVEERRVTAFRNDTNVVRIISPEWTAWLRLGRKGVTLRAPLSSKGIADRDPLGRDGVTRRAPSGVKGLVNRHLLEGGGVKSSSGTPTQVSTQGKTRTTEAWGSRSARTGAPPRVASRVAGA